LAEAEEGSGDNRRGVGRSYQGYWGGPVSSVEFVRLARYSGPLRGAEAGAISTRDGGNLGELPGRGPGNLGVLNPEEPGKPDRDKGRRSN